MEMYEQGSENKNMHIKGENSLDSIKIWKAGKKKRKKLTISKTRLVTSQKS